MCSILVCVLEIVNFQDFLKMLENASTRTLGVPTLSLKGDDVDKKQEFEENPAT